MLTPRDFEQLESRTLEQEILDILNATDEPMSCQDILARCKSLPDSETVSRTVYAMKKADLLMQVGTDKKPGKREVATYRPVSASNHEAGEGEKAHDPIPVEPDKSVSQQLLDIVIAEPGITPQAIRSRFPGDKTSMKAVSNALYGLLKKKRIERRDDAGVERLHPTEKAAAQGNTARKAHKLPYKLMPSAPGAIDTGKSEITSADKAAPAPIIPAQSMAEAPKPTDALEIHFGDDEVLYLVRGWQKFALSNDESARVRRFINRIMPEAACA